MSDILTEDQLERFRRLPAYSDGEGGEEFPIVELSATYRDCICDSHEALRARVRELEQAQEDLADLAVEALNQACSDGDGLVDSMALSSYADALRTLAAMGRFTIEKEHGRRVIGRWKVTP